MASHKDSKIPRLPLTSSALALGVIATAPAWAGPDQTIRNESDTSLVLRIVKGDGKKTVTTYLYATKAGTAQKDLKTLTLPKDAHPLPGGETDSPQQTGVDGRPAGRQAGSGHHPGDPEPERGGEALNRPGRSNKGRSPASYR